MPARTHALVSHTGAKNHLVFPARLHILQIVIDSSKVKEKARLQSQEKKKSIQITNPAAHHRRPTFIFLGQPAKNCLTRSCTSCLWDILVWVVSLSLLPKQNQSCLIFTVAGTWIMLKSYRFTFRSWNRSRLFCAAHLHFLQIQSYVC